MSTQVLEATAPATVIELGDLQSSRTSISSRVSLSYPRPAAQHFTSYNSTAGLVSGFDQPSADIQSLEAGSAQRDALPLPQASSDDKALPRWNQDKITVCRTASGFISEMVMGLNNGAYGALIGYIGAYYGVTYTVVSLLFLSPYAGYTLSALLNNTIHLKLGQRGAVILLTSCRALAFLIVSQHPPFPVLIVVYAFLGFGNGLCDSCFNAYLGSMANSNELLGLLHGSYGLGAVISPTLATAMVSQWGLQWYQYYYVMLGFAVLEAGLSVSSFWTANGTKYREELARQSDGAEGAGGLKQALFRMPWARVTWLLALLMFIYVGAEVTLGGWIVQFMKIVRHGDEFASGMTATGFWLGVMVGRVTLGFVSGRIGEKLAVSVYLVLTMAFELLFWLVPQFYVSAVAVALQGFFLGPIYPAVVVVSTKLLPRHLHVSALGFAIAFGGGGAAILPFLVGAIAQAKGVGALQPIVLSFLVIIFVIWMLMARVRPKSE